jgi:hypothetical protein
VIVVATSVALVPFVTDRLGRSMWPGIAPSFQDALASPTSLRQSGRLDMTTRPRLTDRVVFTVDAPRADFWRGEVFDVWDGQVWTRSDRRQAQLPRSGDTIQIAIDPYDDGVASGTPMRQTFRFETRFAEVLFAAPSPVAVETDKELVGRPDGTAYGERVRRVRPRRRVHGHEQERAPDRNRAAGGGRKTGARRGAQPLRAAARRDVAYARTRGEDTRRARDGASRSRAASSCSPAASESPRGSRPDSCRASATA